MTFRYIETKPIKKMDTSHVHLSEIYSKGKSMPEFCVLSKNGEQVGAWMKCKDYIQDTIWGGKFGVTFNCHGFQYRHGTDPLPSTDKLILAIKYEGKEKELPQMIINVKKTVENLECRLKIPACQRTKFSRAIGNYFVIYGSHLWTKATHTISFFTFLLRGSLNNKGGKIETIGTTPPVKNDTYYFKNGRGYIDLLSKVGINDIESNWDLHKDHKDPYKIHGGGFVDNSNRMAKEAGIVTKKPEKDDDWSF